MAMGSIRAGRAFIELSTDDTKLTKGLLSAQAKLKAFGASVTDLGTKFAALTAAIAVPMGMITKNFVDFDDQMRIAMAKSEATDEEFKKLTDTAKKLGRETSYTAAQVAQGMATMATMGFKTDAIIKSIADFMNLDRATAMNDLAMSAEIAATAMKSFGLAVSDTRRVSDVLTATANGSAQNLTDIGEAMKSAASQANIANVSLEDTCAMLGVLANLGIKGSMAGTALSKTFQRLASGKGVAILEGKGIKTKDANGNLRDMRDILIDIAKVTKTMGNADKIAFLTDVFDVRGSKGGGVIAGNMKDLDAMMEKIAKSGGLAENTAKRMDSGIGGTFRLLLSAVESVKLELGEIIGNFIRPYLAAITNVLGAMAKWVKANRGVVVGFVKVTVVVAGAAAALLALGATLKALSFAVGFMIVGLKALALPVILLLKIFKIFSIVLHLATAAIGVFTSALAILKTAFIALKVAAAASWMSVTLPALGFIAIIGAVIASVILMGDAFRDIWAAMRELGGGFSDAFGLIKEVAKESYEAIKIAFSAGDLAGAAKVGLAALKMVWIAGIMPLKKAWYRFSYFLSDSWSVIVGVILKLGNDCWYGLLLGLKHVGDAIADAWGFIWEGIVDVFEDTMLALQKGWIHTKGMFDSDDEVEAEIRALEKEYEDRRKARERNSDADVNRREKERAALSREWDDANRSVEERTRRGVAENRRDYEASMRDAAKGLAAARAEWQQAVDDVKKKAAQKKGEPGSVEEKEDQLDKIRTGLAARTDDSNKSIAGFDARALMGMFGRDESAAERSANAAEDTRRILTKIETKLEENVFAMR